MRSISVPATLASFVKSLPTMWSTPAKQALRLGAVGRVLVPGVSAVPKSGSGRSSADTRSMSAAVFRRTSSESMKLRTSTYVYLGTGVREFLSGRRAHRLLASDSLIARWHTGPAPVLADPHPGRGGPDRTVGPAGRF